MSRHREHVSAPSVGFSRHSLLPFWLAVLVWGAGLAGCQGAPQTSGNVLAKIGDEELSYADLQTYVERNVNRHREDEAEPAAESRESSVESPVLSRLFDQLLEERLVLRLAHERGLEKTQRSQRMAVDFLIRAEGEPQVSEAEIAAYYEAHRATYQRPDQVRLRQILVSDAKTAAEAREAILGGEDFAVVAARTSEEPQAARGGDQGRLGRDDLPPAFADIIFNLSPGEVSDIVAADYGYHLFQVVERHPAQLMALAEVRDQIEQRLLGEHADELIRGFVQTAKERYHVEVFRNHFPFDYQGAYGG